MKIAILYKSSKNYSYKMLETSPLAGAETAVLRLTTAFKELGHEAFICKKLQDLNKENNIDVLLIKRNPALVLRKECQKAKKVFFYSPDKTSELSFLPLKSEKFKENFVNSVNGILAISNYQSGLFKKDLGLPQKKIFVTRNGIDLKMFENPKIKRKPICIHTTLPVRGLDLQLKIWPEVKKAVPEAIFKVFSSMSLWFRQDKGKMKKTIDELKKLEGVVYSKPVSQKKLAKELLKAKVFLYPNAYILESSGISTIEARAAGCAIVTSNLGGLKEAACGNMLISGKPGSADYISAFIEKTVFLLKNNSYCERISRYNVKTASIYDWKYIARELIDVFKYY